MEFIFTLLENTSIMIIVATVMVIAFARSITKIFTMGVTFKSDIVTRKEQREFEEEMRRDMRSYAAQIQKSVSESLMLVLNNKLKDIDDAKDAADTIRIVKAEIDLQLKNINEKYDNIKAISDEVRNLNTKIQRIEYQNMSNANLNKSDRRSEN